MKTRSYQKMEPQEPKTSEPEDNAYTSLLQASFGIVLTDAEWLQLESSIENPVMDRPDLQAMMKTIPSYKICF
jgi:hypothetical protein